MDQVNKTAMAFHKSLCPIHAWLPHIMYKVANYWLIHSQKHELPFLCCAIALSTINVINQSKWLPFDSYYVLFIRACPFLKWQHIQLKNLLMTCLNLNKYGFSSFGKTTNKIGCSKLIVVMNQLNLITTWSYVMCIWTFPFKKSSINLSDKVYLYN